MLFIVFCTSCSKPKCVMGGCGKERTSGSQHCVLHDLSYRSYGNPDYNAVYKQSQEKEKARRMIRLLILVLRTTTVHNLHMISIIKRHIQERVMIRIMSENMTIQMILLMNGQKNSAMGIMMMDMMMLMIIGKMRCNDQLTFVGKKSPD